MYFVIINRKTGIILATADTETEAMESITQEIQRMESNGQRNPGWEIQARS